MKREKNIEEFTKYLLKEAATESPSPDFVDKVMGTIKLESSKGALLDYKPIISKWGWVFIALLVIGLCTFIGTSNFENPAVLTSIDFSFLNNVTSINLFENIYFSKTFTLTFTLFTILVLVQLIAIKNYFNRQNIV